MDRVALEIEVTSEELAQHTAHILESLGAVVKFRANGDLTNVGGVRER